MSWFTDQKQNKLRPSADAQYKQGFTGSSQFLQQSLDEDAGPPVVTMNLIDNRTVQTPREAESLIEYRQKYHLSLNAMATKLRIPVSILERVELGHPVESKHVYAILARMRSLTVRPNLSDSDVIELRGRLPYYG